MAPSGSRPRESHTLRNGGFLVMAGVLAVGGIYVDNEINSNAICALKLAEGHKLGAVTCALGVQGISGTHTPSQITGIGLKNESLPNDDVTVSFGEISMEMSGTATVHYNYMWHVPHFPAYSTMFYNKNNAGTTKVIAMPCFNFGSYKNDMDGDAPSTSNGNKSHVIVHYNMAPNGTSISSIDVNAGRMDYCMPQTTIADENLWDLGPLHIGKFGSLEYNYYREAVETLEIDAAMAQACPENLLNMNTVEKDVGKVAIGEAILDKTPAQAAAIESAYRAGRVHYSIESPQKRLSYYRGVYEKARALFMSEKNAPKHTRMEPMEISDISTKTCNLNGVLKVGN